MASVGHIIGKMFRVDVSEDNGTTWKQLGCTTEDNFNGDSDTDDEPCKDGGAFNDPEIVAQNWNINSTGFVAYDIAPAKNGADQLTDYWLAKTPLLVRYGTGVDGDPYIQGKALVKSISNNAPVSAKATFSVEIVGKQIPTKGVYPAS